jgi:peroxiredoxin family protein
MLNVAAIEENMYLHVHSSEDFHHKFLTARIITTTGWKVEVFRIYYGLRPLLHRMTNDYKYMEVEITGTVNGKKVFSCCRLSLDYMADYHNDALLEAVREGLRSIVNYALYGCNDNQTVEHFLFGRGQVRTESIK